MIHRLWRGKKWRGVYAPAGVLIGCGVLAAVGVAGAAEQAETKTIGVREDAPQQRFFDPANPDPEGDPPVVAIDTGDTIKWDFTGATQPHNAAEDDSQPQPDADPTWPGYATPYSFVSLTTSRTFNYPGDYKFYCQAHPQMTGTIKVTGDPVEPTPTPPPGGAPPPPPPAGPHPDADGEPLRDPHPDPHPDACAGRPHVDAAAHRERQRRHRRAGPHGRQGQEPAPRRARHVQALRARRGDAAREEALRQGRPHGQRAGAAGHPDRHRAQLPPQARPLHGRAAGPRRVRQSLDAAARGLPDPPLSDGAHESVPPARRRVVAP
jgi:plastocyanin